MTQKGTAFLAFDRQKIVLRAVFVLTLWDREGLKVPTAISRITHVGMCEQNYEPDDISKCSL